MICIENWILSQKFENEDYNGQDMWKECQRKCLRIPQKEKGPPEIH
jgi:hypothetical protein